MAVKDGVQITLREIYDSLQELTISVTNLVQRMENLEERLKEFDATDERSRLALSTAVEVQEKVKKAEQNRLWLTRSIIGSLIAAIIGLLLHMLQN